MFSSRERRVGPRGGHVLRGARPRRHHESRLRAHRPVRFGRHRRAGGLQSHLLQFHLRSVSFLSARRMIAAHTSCHDSSSNTPEHFLRQRVCSVIPTSTEVREPYFFVKFLTQFSSILAACGGEMTAMRGAFNSPRYPDPYPNNVECVWTFRASPGNKIQLTFRYRLQKVSHNSKQIFSNQQHLQAKFVESRAVLPQSRCWQTFSAKNGKIFFAACSTLRSQTTAIWTSWRFGWTAQRGRCSVDSAATLFPRT